MVLHVRISHIHCGPNLSPKISQMKGFEHHKFRCSHGITCENFPHLLWTQSLTKDITDEGF
uniref:Uncharacterized protein n=1 Tax=Octopus bimaculoides TaxID=37653 RepID=A0A0L8FLJ5_OCTBM